MSIRRRIRCSPLVLVIGICIYIYLIGVYFVHYSSVSLEELEIGERQIHIHEHIKHGLPAARPVPMFKDFVEIVRYRQERFRKAQNRSPQDGPGERGAAVELNETEKELADILFPRETFNVVASDKIAMDRTIPDIRDPQCKTVQYPDKLPNASVVIVFHNEAWSPIFRTVHSVVNRTPPQYLHEVVLLDDHSDREELLESKMQTYIDHVWPDGVVKLVRTSERGGLIRARLAGAKEATGEVLIFLDAHCEVTDQWIEPLLTRIKESNSAMLCPMIDGIKADTMEYPVDQGAINIGGFSWDLTFNWESLPQREKKRRKSDVDPVRSPTMAGGLFAVDRGFFWEVGGYDEGMEIWGGENIEISFRVWMCGGSLEYIPCSRVGHIFRGGHPYTFPGKKDTFGLNSKRLADVWMDEYKKHFYLIRKDLLENDEEAGDISDRVALRQHLNCKSFKWFLQNVYPEKFVPDENVYAYGMVRNPASNQCLDTMGMDERSKFAVGIFGCQAGSSQFQQFGFSLSNEIRKELGCLDADGIAGSPIFMMQCHGSRGNQEWQHNKDTMAIMHSSGNCIDRAATASSVVLSLAPCDGKDGQKWEFENYL